MNKHWLFQSNPKKYDLQLCLEKCKVLHWKDNNKGLTVGDIAYFFECGGLNHICAKGKIISNPAMMDKSDCEQENKCLKKEFKEASRVEVEIIKVLAKPIKIEDLEDHPVLKNNRILKYIIDNKKSCNGSCFSMTEEEAKALDKIITE